MLPVSWINATQPRRMRLMTPVRRGLVLVLIAVALDSSWARADERRFTYTYEPETLPQGAVEFEQWITLRSQRTKGGEVKQENYNLWELREELEYGVTDNYSLSLYLNTSAE